MSGCRTEVLPLAAENRIRYAENAPARRFFTFSPLMGDSPSAVSKAKTHPRRKHFQCKAVLNEMIYVRARHKIAGILAYAEIFNTARAQSSRLKPYCIRFPAAHKRRKAQKPHGCAVFAFSAVYKRRAGCCCAAG